MIVDKSGSATAFVPIRPGVAMALDVSPGSQNQDVQHLSEAAN